MSVNTILVADSLCAFIQSHSLLLLDHNYRNKRVSMSICHVRTFELLINFQDMCALILKFVLISEMHPLECLFIISH
jgi:hypothetical protein